jgi:hypothetical protein
MEDKMKEQRIYPQCCVSAYCDKFGSDCDTCGHKKVLDEFNDWRKKHAAVRKDPIWCPAVWTAQK